MNQTFAVKRISRERSLNDSPTLISVFSEISCLEMLKGCVGVCQLHDFGVHGREYWLVMEEGVCNLEEWRHTKFSKRSDSSVDIISNENPSSTGICIIQTESDLVLLLLLVSSTLK